MRIFEHDKSRHATVNVTSNFSFQQLSHVMDSHANSPDINLIEHACVELNKNIRQKDNNVSDLDFILNVEWNVIP